MASLLLTFSSHPSGLASDHSEACLGDPCPAPSLAFPCPFPYPSSTVVVGAEAQFLNYFALRTIVILIVFSEQKSPDLAEFSHHQQKVDADATDVADIQILNVDASLKHPSELLCQSEWRLPNHETREEVRHLG